MLIDVEGLRGDSSTGYAYSGLVEQEIANIVGRVAGLPVRDILCDHARPEYDFFLGELPMELKITSGHKIPVEVAKDEAGLIPSGVALSHAPYILYLSNGHGNKIDGSPPVGKLRLLKRTWLLTESKKTPPSFYKSGEEASTEDALVCYLGPFFNGEPNELWLGDMLYVQDEKKEKWLYDTATFVPSRKAAGLLQWIHQAYLDGDIK